MRRDHRTPQWVTQALGIASVIGAMSGKGLVSTDTIYRCLHMLVDRLQVPEELHAIYLICKHANTTLLSSTFVNQLEERAESIPAGADVVVGGEPVNVSEIVKVSLLRFCGFWLACGCRC